jgi:hypothetical protein
MFGRSAHVCISPSLQRTGHHKALDGLLLCATSRRGTVPQFRLPELSWVASVLTSYTKANIHLPRAIIDNYLLRVCSEADLVGGAMLCR